MLSLIKYKKKELISFFNLIKSVLFFLFFLYLKNKNLFNYTLKKNLTNLLEIYIYYQFFFFLKSISNKISYHSQLFFFYNKNQFSVLSNSFFVDIFNKNKILDYNKFDFNLKKISRKSLIHFNYFKLKKSKIKNPLKKIQRLCEMHRNYCFSPIIYDARIRNNYIFDIHFYLQNNHNNYQDNFIIHDFLSSRYHHEILRLNQKIKINFEIELFMEKNNLILIMDLVKHKQFCDFVKDELCLTKEFLRSTSFLDVYKKNYFFKNNFFYKSIPLKSYILTIDSFNLYFSSKKNMKDFLFTINTFSNDYSVPLYDPCIIFNQLIMYFLDSNFLIEFFNFEQKLKILYLYLDNFQLNDFELNFSNFKKIDFFIRTNLETIIVENIILIFLNIYGLFYRINFEIYLKFYSIEINHLVQIVESLLNMDRPREFSLIQFDFSKSKEIEKICKSLSRKKNFFVFFIAFMFYLLPGIVWIFWLEYMYSFTIFGGILRFCSPVIGLYVMIFCFLFLCFLIFFLENLMNYLFI